MEQKKKQLQTVLANLALELEIKEGRRFNVHKGIEEVVKVIKFSLESDDVTILNHLKKFSSLISENQKQFFRNKGIEVDKIDNPESDADEGIDIPEEPTEKKKIVYRGQVKWV